VQAGDAESGEFIDSLTGDGLGDKLGFIVSFYNQGRFAADQESGRSYVSFEDAIPEAWSDHPLVGSEGVGVRFDEHPDAEETYKERVNAKEIEWGHGPKISTTHNFTGLALISPVEGDEDDENQVRPVRLSLMRTNLPAVRKLHSLRASAGRNKSFWEFVFDLSTFRKDFARGSSYLLQVRRGRKTADEEKQNAVALAQEVIGGRTQDNAENAADSEKPVEPTREGGVDL